MASLVDESAGPAWSTREPFPAPSVDPTCPEATFRGGPQRRGQFTVRLPRTQPAVHWARNISGFTMGEGNAWGVDLPLGPDPDDEPEEIQGSGYVGPAPIVCGDTLYLAEKGGQVFAIDRESGRFRWRYAVPGEHQSVDGTPLVDGKRLIFGALDDRIRALDRDSGELLWAWDSGFDTLASPGLLEGHLLSSNKLGQVFALDPRTGAPLWERSLASTVTSSPAFTEDGAAVIVGERAGTVTALSLDDGRPLWTFQTDDSVLSTAAIHDGRVFVGSWDNHLYALDAATGEPQWSWEAEANVTASAAVTQGLVIAGSWDWRVAALDAATGSPRWVTSLSRDVLASPITDGRTVVVLTEDGVAWGLDLWSGEVLWDLGIGVRAVASPGAAGRDLYVLGVNGDLWALREE
jgi:outer membrane protein assembly factor BamB